MSNIEPTRLGPHGLIVVSGLKAGVRLSVVQPVEAKKESGLNGRGSCDLSQRGPRSNKKNMISDDTVTFLCRMLVAIAVTLFMSARVPGQEIEDSTLCSAVTEGDGAQIIGEPVQKLWTAERNTCGWSVDLDNNHNSLVMHHDPAPGGKQGAAGLLRAERLTFSNQQDFQDEPDLGQYAFSFMTEDGELSFHCVVDSTVLEVDLAVSGAASRRSRMRNVMRKVCKVRRCDGTATRVAPFTQPRYIAHPVDSCEAAHNFLHHNFVGRAETRLKADGSARITVTSSKRLWIAKTDFTLLRDPAEEALDLPNFSWPNATAAECGALETFMTNLVVHENGHFFVTKQFAHDFSGTQTATGASEGAARQALIESFSKTLLRERSQLLDLQVLYDSVTQHGYAQSKGPASAFPGGTDADLICPSR